MSGVKPAEVIIRAEIPQRNYYLVYNLVIYINGANVHQHHAMTFQIAAYISKITEVLMKFLIVYHVTKFHSTNNNIYEQ